MTEELKLLKYFVTDCNASNKSTDKKEVIKKYIDHPFIERVLQFTYSPYIQFGVTSKNCKKQKEKLGVDPDYYTDDLFGLLEDLNFRIITGHNAIIAVNSFCAKYSEYEDIIYNILDKNLKCRIDASSINKVKPKTVPTFDVALAVKYEPKTAALVNWEDSWYVSRKLDGLRCIGMIDENGKVTMYSRSGKEFKTLQKVKDEIKSLGLINYVFDGEICLTDEKGDEDFNGILKEYNKKDHTIENPRYKIFDFIKLEDFNEQYSDIIFSQRQEQLYEVMEEYNGEILSILEQVEVLSDEHFMEWVSKGEKFSWEGVMLRKNAPYLGKRSNELLKVKQFHDAEYTVKRIETGPFRVITEKEDVQVRFKKYVDNAGNSQVIYQGEFASDSDPVLYEDIDGQSFVEIRTIPSKEVEEDVMTNVIIEHKGYEVSVGSGFSLKERRRYYANPELIIGKTITVEYFEETKNQEGTVSLRFPSVKAIYEGNREI